MTPGAVRARRGRRGRSRGVLTFLLVLLVPLAWMNVTVGARLWRDGQLARGGELVQAQVLRAGTAPGPRGIGLSYGVTYRVPGGGEHHAVVNAATYEAAQAAGTLPVRVLPDRPGVQRAEGEAGGGWPVWGVLALDLAFVWLAITLTRPG